MTSSAAVKYPTHLWMLWFTVGGIVNSIIIEFLFWVYCCGRHWNLPFVGLPLIQASNTSFQFLLVVIVHLQQSEDTRDCPVFIASARLGHTTFSLHLDCCQLCVCVCKEIQLHLVHLVKQQGFFHPNLCSACLLPLSRIPHLSLLLGWSLAKAKGFGYKLELLIWF